MKHAFEVVSKATKLGGQVAPASRAAGTAQSAAVNRVDYSEAIVALLAGAASGSPTAINVSVDVQHSDDGTAWSNLATNVASVTAANSTAYAGVDLSGAKKFVRAVVNVSFTGGTSPEIECACAVILGGTRKIPAA